MKNTIIITLVMFHSIFGINYTIKMKTLEPITINGEIKKARIVDIYDGSIIYNGNQNTAIFSIVDRQNHRDLYSRE